MDFYFAQKTFFLKNLLPNSGCGLSTGAAYTRVNTVIAQGPLGRLHTGSTFWIDVGIWERVIARSVHLVW